MKTPDDQGPENLREILARLFTARGWGRRQARRHLDLAWEAVAGADYVPYSRVLGLRRGVLEIEVDNGILLQELAQFHKRRLLDGLRAKLPGQPLKELRFRAGARMNDKA